MNVGQTDRRELNLDPSCRFASYFALVAETEDLLVVNKRPAVLTMGSSADEPSVLTAAREYLCATNPAHHGFVAVIGRLDHPVGGLLLIAKHPSAADRLWSLQKQGRIRKSYAAIVHGRVDRASGILSDWLVKAKRHRSVRIVSDFEEGAVRAELRYRVVSRSNDATAVVVRLRTGRKHQIRAQLAHAGFPVWGDRKYGGTPSSMAGIGLFCRSIRLISQCFAERQGWQLPLPADWPILTNFGE